MTVLAAIPARWGSTRFPGKPLAPIGGRPMIAWVVEAARAAGRVDDVAVVTDHAEIARAAVAAGARAIVSAEPAASGTDRIASLLAADAEAARARIVVNVQGDEPLIEPAAIDAAIGALDDDPKVDIATLVRPLRDRERADDPHLVKVTIGAGGRALSFSRTAPAHSEAGSTGRSGIPLVPVHIGLYAYRRAAFERFVGSPPTALEKLERLEQLRALELGLVIGCVVFDSRSIAVDTPEDLARVEAVLRPK